MIVLKIIGIVLAVLVLLLLLLLPAPIDLVLRLDEKKGLRYYIRICGIPIKIDSGKKKPKKKPKKKTKLTALIQRAFGMKNAERQVEKPAKQAEASPALQETVSMVMGMAEDVLSAVRKCKIVRFRVKAVSGGEDAALDYGTACAVVYPLAAWLKNNLKMTRRAMKIELGWDYDRSEALYEVYFALRIRLLRVLITLWRIVRRNMQGD